MDTASNNSEVDIGIPLSTVIRERLTRSAHRFHANDNISAFLEPGELDQLQAEVEQKMQGVLESLVIDTQSDHNTQETARACSHHLCPIIGKVWVGVMPNEHSNLIGLSKYTRLIDWVMSRPQIQEEAVSQVAALLQEKLQPDGLAIVMEADHFCMHWRGVKDTDAKMINSVMRGVFLKDANLRREFLSLLANRK